MPFQPTLVMETFAKSEEQVKDGMDIALCVWNKETNILEYAGANNPIYIIEKNSEKSEVKKLLPLIIIITHCI